MSDSPTPPSWLGTAESAVFDLANLAVVDAICDCGQPIRAFVEVDSDDAITRMGPWWHPGTEQFGLRRDRGGLMAV